MMALALVFNRNNRVLKGVNDQKIKTFLEHAIVSPINILISIGIFSAFNIQNSSHANLGVNAEFDVLFEIITILYYLP